MKFFSWMQKKFNGGGQSHTNSNQLPSTAYDEKKQAQYSTHNVQEKLLSIGTLGNHEIIEKSYIHTQSLSIMSEEDDFTKEEVGQLQKELRNLLRKKELSVAASATVNYDLPLDRFLNCPSSLEVDRRISNSKHEEDDEEEEVMIDRTIRVIIDRCKTLCRERKKDQNVGFGKKSLSFLFNKMFFVCGNGLDPSPPTSMRDSRMEKLLRTMLSKKFNQAQNSSSMKKKQLEDGKDEVGEKKKQLEDGKDEVDWKKKQLEDGKDEVEEKNNGHQWVKTDSEYIVLEM